MIWSGITKITRDRDNGDGALEELQRFGISTAYFELPKMEGLKNDTLLLWFEDFGRNEPTHYTQDWVGV